MHLFPHAHAKQKMLVVKTIWCSTEWMSMKYLCNQEQILLVQCCVRTCIVCRSLYSSDLWYNGSIGVWLNSATSASSAYVSRGTPRKSYSTVPSHQPRVSCVQTTGHLVQPDIIFSFSNIPCIWYRAPIDANRRLKREVAEDHTWHHHRTLRWKPYELFARMLFSRSLVFSSNHGQFHYYRRCSPNAWHDVWRCSSSLWRAEHPINLHLLCKTLWPTWLDV